MVTRPMCHVTVETVKVRKFLLGSLLHLISTCLLSASIRVWRHLVLLCSNQVCWRDTERVMQSTAWDTKIQDGLSVVIFWLNKCVL